MGGGQSSGGRAVRHREPDKLNGFIGIKDAKSDPVVVPKKADRVRKQKEKEEKKVQDNVNHAGVAVKKASAPNVSRIVRDSVASNPSRQSSKIVSQKAYPVPKKEVKPVAMPQAALHPEVAQAAVSPTPPAPTFKALMKQVLELAKEQRARVGKFRKDEKHNAMELYEVMGLENDEFFQPPNELQIALRSYTFPPLNMSNLKQVDTLDRRTYEEILGKAEAKRRAEEEDLELPEQLEIPKTSTAILRDKLRRQAVSSEVTQTCYVTPKSEKSSEQIMRITKLFSDNILFKSLDTRDRKLLFHALEQEDFNPGDVIIEQGEDGDSYYVIDNGRCQITIRDEDETDEQEAKVVGFIGQGDGFGELGLMYGTYRAATITAVTEVTCWVLDRESYRGILLNATIKKRDRYMEFLDKIPMLKSVEPYEKARIADVLEPLEVRAGDEIMKEGTEGDSFYFIESGEVQVSNKKAGNICVLKTGEYFGELALLFRQPRKATVVAITDCFLVSLNRKNFQNYLGPIESILKRNTETYDEYLKAQNKDDSGLY